ncbi:MAG: bifunctional oligoribonuclease/PAP phosphatase NrnA [Deltaproteobacteria bacterium]|nr:bifunctional oligoribonuclease/PAP phosphatase NrnA [Deltaproteobacteria bacterium]MBW1929461.1 bifunctional oligoribonuclease/PAP phosphatase NrnA [Deltaproteobacteria bacterium]MBW2023880.1 bifunctional oligoribonuclease/PAP phosphatase NrnA [Deltaproteobacteria bacterium]MBW2124169.1 bifunctional oligoribonuclease/PAP phosphatase NrnA [Deltaproteobacteria bacterium]RLB19416.1 MAG: bifunctional oligoribonuclease/PAP phosphatase NrnA [Deltaproteobacteria bacterium]
MSPGITQTKIVERLRQGNAFILTTHKDPDGDGIGSMLALGEALRKAGKRIALVLEETVPVPFDLLKGAEQIQQLVDLHEHWDGVLILDCADEGRLGGLSGQLRSVRPWMNIDHHETNTYFGDMNLIQEEASSTGELVYYLIREADFELNSSIAENLFAAIQTDTGSFRYDNTTAGALRIAAELLDLGIKPWEVTQKIMDGHDLPRLKLLRFALDTIEIHHGGKIAIMTLTKDMFEKAGAGKLDSERFVDYARFIRGVEIAALIRQTGKDEFKFSLRSNNKVNVADLASVFGGGGHARAAGFDGKGELSSLKTSFIEEAARFLNAGR